MIIFLAVAGILTTIYFAVFHETQSDRDKLAELQRIFGEDLEKLIEEGEEEEYQTFKKNMDRYHEEKK